MKSNCHIHLTGSLRPSDLRKFGREVNVDYLDYEPLEELYVFKNDRIWTLAKAITSTEVGFLRAINIVAEREARDGVDYLELTFNPTGMIRAGMSIGVIANCIGLAASNALQAHGIKVKYKFGVNRKHGPESIQEVVELYQAVGDKWRWGIDLNGDELLFPTSDFMSEFKKISSNIPVSIHAGENSGTMKSLRDAVDLKPQRIAHALAASNEENLLKEIKLRGIVIEVCPTANLKLGLIKDIRDHPAKDFARHGIPMVIGTDDPAFFQNTISMEINRLAEIGLGKEDFVEMKTGS